MVLHFPLGDGMAHCSSAVILYVTEDVSIPSLNFERWHTMTFHNGIRGLLFYVGRRHAEVGARIYFVRRVDSLTSTREM